MDPWTATIVIGLIQKAGGAIFAIAQQHIMRRLGLDSSQPKPSDDIQPLLQGYLQQLKGRLDEDRIAKLYGAFSKLTEIGKTLFLRTSRQRYSTRLWEQFAKCGERVYVNIKFRALSVGVQIASLTSHFKWGWYFSLP